MKIDPQDLITFQKYETLHKGIFSHTDLKNLFLTSDRVIFKRKLDAFIKARLLLRFTRGFYATPSSNLEWLSQRICPNSALSLGTILGKELLIGSIPNKTIYAVKQGRSRIYQSPIGKIVHLGISPHLWFGYDQWVSGVRYANKEKAFLDTLYFYQKGHRFSFNIYSDIDFRLLDKNMLRKYLKKYPNPKFRKFVTTIINQEV